jgi:hypothetical protein
MSANNSLFSLFFKKIAGREAVFSLEIAIALLVKFLLLGGLWWLLFEGKKQFVDEAIIVDKIFGVPSSVIISQKNQEGRQ